MTDINIKFGPDPNSLNALRKSVESQLSNVNLNISNASMAKIRNDISKISSEIRLTVSDQSVSALRNRISKELGRIPIEISGGKAIKESANEIKSKVEAYFQRNPIKARVVLTTAENKNAVGAGAKNLSKQILGEKDSVKDMQKALKEVNKGIKELTQSTGDAERVTDSFASRVGFAATRLTAYLIPAKIFFSLGNAIASSTEDIKTFNAEINKLSQILDNNADRANKVADKVLKIGIAYGQSGKDLIKITNTLAQAGNKFRTDSEIVKTVDAIAKSGLAATFGDIRNTTQGVVAVLNQFNISGEKSIEVLDIANQLAKKFAFESDNLFTAVQTGGAAFALAGGTIEDFSATVASLRQLTRISSSSIGTGLNTIALRILRPDTIRFLEQLTGGAIRDAQGNLKGIRDILIETARATQGFSEEQLQPVIEKLSGIRQGKLLTPLLIDIQRGLSGGQSIFAETLREASEASGSLSRDAAVGLERIDVKLQRVGAKFEEVFKNIAQDKGISRLVDDFARLANSAADFVNSISPILPTLLRFGTIKLGLGIVNSTKEVLRGVERATKGRTPEGFGPLAFTDTSYDVGGGRTYAGMKASAGKVAGITAHLYGSLKDIQQRLEAKISDVSNRSRDRITALLKSSESPVAPPAAAPPPFYNPGSYFLSKGQKASRPVPFGKVINKRQAASAYRLRTQKTLENDARLAAQEAQRIQANQFIRSYVATGNEGYALRTTPFSGESISQSRTTSPEAFRLVDPSQRGGGLNFEGARRAMLSTGVSPTRVSPGIFGVNQTGFNIGLEEARLASVRAQKQQQIAYNLDPRGFQASRSQAIARQFSNYALAERILAKERKELAVLMRQQRALLKESGFSTKVVNQELKQYSAGLKQARGSLATLKLAKDKARQAYLQEVGSGPRPPALPHTGFPGSGKPRDFSLRGVIGPALTFVAPMMLDQAASRFTDGIKPLVNQQGELVSDLRGQIDKNIRTQTTSTALGYASSGMMLGGMIGMSTGVGMPIGAALGGIGGLALGALTGGSDSRRGQISALASALSREGTFKGEDGKKRYGQSVGTLIELLEQEIPKTGLTGNKYIDSFIFSGGPAGFISGGASQIASRLSLSGFRSSSLFDIQQYIGGQIGDILTGKSFLKSGRAIANLMEKAEKSLDIPILGRGFNWIGRNIGISGIDDTDRSFDASVARMLGTNEGEAFSQSIRARAIGLAKNKSLNLGQARQQIVADIAAAQGIDITNRSNAQRVKQIQSLVAGSLREFPGLSKEMDMLRKSTLKLKEAMRKGGASVENFIARFTTDTNTLNIGAASRGIQNQVSEQIWSSILGQVGNFQIPETVAENLVANIQNQLRTVTVDTNTNPRGLIRDIIRNNTGGAIGIGTSELATDLSIIQRLIAEVAASSVTSASGLSIVKEDPTQFGKFLAAMAGERIAAFNPNVLATREGKNRFEEIIPKVLQALETSPEQVRTDPNAFAQSFTANLSDEIRDRLRAEIRSGNAAFDSRNALSQRQRQIQERQLQTEGQLINTGISRIRQTSLLGASSSDITSQLATLFDATKSDGLRVAADELAKAQLNASRAIELNVEKDLSNADVIARSLENLNAAQIKYNSELAKSTNSLSILRARFEETTKSLGDIIGQFTRTGSQSTADFNKARVSKNIFDSSFGGMFREGGQLYGVNNARDLLRTMSPKQFKQLVSRYGGGLMGNEAALKAEGDVEGTFGELAIEGAGGTRYKGAIEITRVLRAAARLGGGNASAEELFNLAKQQAELFGMINSEEDKQLVAMKTMNDTLSQSLGLQTKIEDNVSKLLDIIGNRQAPQSSSIPAPSRNVRQPSVNEQQVNTFVEVRDLARETREAKEAIKASHSELGKTLGSYAAKLAEVYSQIGKIQLDANLNVTGINAVGKEEVAGSVVTKFMEMLITQLETDGSTFSLDLANKMKMAIKVLTK